MNKQNDTSKAYIIKTFRVSESVFNYVWHGLLNYNDLVAADKHLFAHILCGHIINYKRSGWTPICSQLIRKDLYKADWRRLYNRQLIEYIPYDIKRRLSSEYRVKPDIFRHICNLFPRTTDEIIGSVYFNLCNGKSLKRKKPQKTIFTSSGNKVFSEYQEAAIKNIRPCKVNRLEVDLILKQRQNILADGNYTEKQYLKFIHDFRCWEGIVNRRTEDSDNNFIIYQPAFKTQGSGRLTELDGCYQNISKELKGAMFKNTGYKNYDLKSSQILGAKAEFESANLNTQWFDEYMKRGKHYYADNIGVSVDCWKGILLSILFGGFPKVKKNGSLAQLKSEDLIIYKCIKNHIFSELGIEVEWLPSEKKHDIIATKSQIRRVYNILDKTIELCRDLILNVRKWHDFIADNYVRITHGRGGKIYYYTNQCKKKLFLNEFLKKPNKGEEFALTPRGKRKLAAHILQGKEATFVHYLTKLSTESVWGGYRVVSNQHDGLIVYGDIPPEAILQAKSISNLKYAEFEEKPIC